MKTIPFKLAAHFSKAIRQTTELATIAVVFALFASASRLLAVQGQFLRVQGTNVILFWPSLGYEEYMIQYRPTLNAVNPWTVLTNNYFANSTNLTTFVITGAVPAGSTNVTGGGGGVRQGEFLKLP